MNVETFLIWRIFTTPNLCMKYARMRHTYFIVFWINMGHFDIDASFCDEEIPWTTGIEHWNLLDLGIFVLKVWWSHFLDSMWSCFLSQVWELPPLAATIMTGFLVLFTIPCKVLLHNIYESHVVTCTIEFFGFIKHIVLHAVEKHYTYSP